MRKVLIVFLLIVCNASAITHRATLRWNRGNYPASVQYRVYRSRSKTGTYTRLAQITVPSYVDTAVSKGVTYWYFVTAYNTVTKCESVNSNIVSTKIP